MTPALIPETVRDTLAAEKSKLLEGAPDPVRDLIARADAEPSRLFVSIGAEAVLLVKRANPGSDAGTVIERVAWDGGADYAARCLDAWATFVGPAVASC